MVKGCVFTIGVLATLGGFGFAALSVFAAGMSDAPGQSADAGLPTAVGAVGIVMCIGALFIP